MDALALAIAIVAVVVFLGGPHWPRLANYLGVGLALLTAAWIIDAVALTGHFAHVTHH